MDPQSPCKKSCVVPMHLIPEVETSSYLEAPRPASLACVVKFQPMRAPVLNKRSEALEDRHPTLSSDFYTHAMYMHTHRHTKCVQILL